MGVFIFPQSSPQQGLTLGELIEQVQDELRNVNIANKITRWLNMSVTEIANAYTFQKLHKYTTVNTEVGIADVVLASDFHWLKSIGIPVRDVKLYPLDETLIAEDTPNYRVLKGTVSNYYFSGNSNMGLLNVPASIETIEYAYQRRPVKMTAVENYCDLPEEWHNLVAQKATTKGHRYDGNSEGVSLSERAEVRLLRDLGTNVYKRPDQPFVMSSGNRSSRPARPRLPSNYPRSRY